MQLKRVGKRKLYLTWLFTINEKCLLFTNVELANMCLSASDAVKKILVGKYLSKNAILSLLTHTQNVFW